MAYPRGHTSYGSLTMEKIPNTKANLNIHLDLQSEVQKFVMYGDLIKTKVQRIIYAHL